MNNSKSTRPRDMLLHLKDTLSIEDDKLFKACISVCSSVRNLLMWLDLALGPVSRYTVVSRDFGKDQITANV